MSVAVIRFTLLSFPQIGTLKKIKIKITAKHSVFQYRGVIVPLGSIMKLLTFQVLSPINAKAKVKSSCH